MILPFILSVVAGGIFIIVARYGLEFLLYVARGLRASIPTKRTPAENPEDEHIQILVLGDIGRSPRMQYHAISAAKNGKKVDIVAFKGELRLELLRAGLCASRLVERRSH